MARVLLVDDEKDIRDMFLDALKLHGHQVDVAASAEEAMKRAANRSYDVAIIDYVLPDKRGLDLLQELRRRQSFLRAIIISGQIDHDVLDAGELERQLKERIAADRYLPKPTSIDSLVRAIEDVLKPTAAGDWKQMAAAAVAAQGVKTKHVKDMDRALHKARKKRKT
ncbi:MAG: response regulator [Burkholderiales bacterium]